MINSLFFIFMLVLLLIPLSSAHGQTARDTVIHSAIDGDNNPVPNGGSTTSTSITFIYSEVIDNQPQADKFKCRLDGSGSDPFVDCTNFIDFPANFNSTVTYPPPTLQLGMHKFEVIACMTPGPNEICDKSPATWTWFIVDFNTFITSAIDSSDVNVTQDGMTNYDDITFTYHATVLNDDNPDTPVNATADGFVCSLDFADFTDCSPGATQSYSNRSEERRVVKECRSRCFQYHYKKIE